jgi:hypothetical protein
MILFTVKDNNCGFCGCAACALSLLISDFKFFEYLLLKTPSIRHGYGFKVKSSTFVDLILENILFVLD